MAALFHKKYYSANMDIFLMIRRRRRADHNAMQKFIQSALFGQAGPAK
jgi:hypothetical protein